MSDKNNPLEPVRASHEEEFFHKQNQALIEKMKAKVALEKAVGELKEGTAVADETLLGELAGLGVTRDTLPILHLAPLLQVAWADGEIQIEERELLLKAADEAGAHAGSPARAELEKLLASRPPQAFFDAALSFEKLVMATLPPDQAAKAKESLLHRAKAVAKASGGVFGLFGKVDDTEKAALDQIAAKLGTK